MEEVLVRIKCASPLEAVFENIGRKFSHPLAIRAQASPTRVSPSAVYMNIDKLETLLPGNADRTTMTLRIVSVGNPCSSFPL